MICHTAHIPLQAFILLPHGKVPKNCSQLKGTVLPKVTSSLEASAFQWLVDVGDMKA